MANDCYRCTWVVYFSIFINEYIYLK
jgi:hypothetical protein